MPVNEVIPFKLPALAFTARASAAIKGKRFVKVSGDRTGGGGGGAEGSVTVGVGLSSDVENVYKVAQCVAKDPCIGVAAWDTASGAELKVYAAGVGVILPVKAGEALTAGWEVEANAEGEAIKLAAGKALGYVMTKCESGKDAEIKLY